MGPGVIVPSYPLSEALITIVGLLEKLARVHIALVSMIIKLIEPLQDIVGSWAGPQRENFSGGTKVDTGPPNLIGPPEPYRGPCR